MSNTVYSFGREVEIPEPIESQGKGDFIAWGKDNQYPNFLNQLYYDSPYQSGIINGKVHYITSSGLDIKAANAEQLLAIKLFLQNQETDYSVNEIIELLAKDLELYNGFCFKGVWSKEGNLSFIEHVDFDRVRVNADCSRYFYSEDWSAKKQTEEDTGYKEYLPFNTSINRGEFLFYFKTSSKPYNKGRKRTDLGVYPKPTYQGGITDLMSDVEISNFHFYELKNGMKAGTIITLTNGVPADDERRAVESAYKEGLTDREGAGGVMINFADGQDQIPDIQNLNGNDLDKRYLMTEDAVRKKIFVSHSVSTPAIFGIDTQGALGNQAQMENGYSIFVKTYVRGRQKMIEDSINFVMNSVGITGSITLKEPEPLFASETEEVEDVEFTEESTITPNEDAFANTKNFNDILIGKLAQLGRKKTKGKIVAEREVKDGYQTKESEGRFVKKCTNKVYYFLDALDEAHLNVLKMLEEGNDANTIQNALELTPRKLNQMVADIKAGGYLDDDYQVTEKGKDVLLVEGRELQEFEVVYTYELRSDESGPAKLPNDRTRPFCEALLDLNREYTRAEIESLNSLSPFAAQGLDVWNYRGGWYNKNGKNRPSCRHIWKQKVIFK